MHRIEHIVVLMLENRSCFSVFGDYEQVIGSAHEPHIRQQWINQDLDGNVYRPMMIDDAKFRFSVHLDNSAVKTARAMRNGMSGFVRILHQDLVNANVQPETSKVNSQKGEALVHSAKQAREHKHLKVKSATRSAKGSKPILTRVNSSNYARLGSAQLGQPMYYFKRGSLPCSHALADRFVVLDQYYSSAPSCTWTNRLLAMSGECHGIYETPSNFEQVPFQDLVKQDQESIFTLMQDQGVSYKVYFGDVPLTLLMEQTWRPEILQQHAPMAEFYAACKTNTLPAVSWIEPKYSGNGNDSHPPHSWINAERLIGQVYNALRQNDKVWSKTLLLVTCDEAGGLADPLVPPLAPEWLGMGNLHHPFHKQCHGHAHRPNGECVTHGNGGSQSISNSTSLAESLAVCVAGGLTDLQLVNPDQVYNIAPPNHYLHSLGLRVPTLLVSPHLPRGYVDHTIYDHTSVLKAICERFGMDCKRLGRRVSRVQTFWHLFQVKPQDLLSWATSQFLWQQSLSRFWYDWAQAHFYRQAQGLAIPATPSGSPSHVIPLTFQSENDSKDVALLTLPKHDRSAHYTGTGHDWTRFQIDMFSCLTYTMYTLQLLKRMAIAPAQVVHQTWSWLMGSYINNVHHSSSSPVKQ